MNDHELSYIFKALYYTSLNIDTNLIKKIIKFEVTRKCIKFCLF